VPVLKGNIVEKIFFFFFKISLFISFSKENKNKQEVKKKID